MDLSSPAAGRGDHNGVPASWRRQLRSFLGSCWRPQTAERHCWSIGKCVLVTCLNARSKSIKRTTTPDPPAVVLCTMLIYYILSAVQSPMQYRACLRCRLFYTLKKKFCHCRWGHTVCLSVAYNNRKHQSSGTANIVLNNMRAYCLYIRVTNSPNGRDHLSFVSSF